MIILKTANDEQVPIEWIGPSSIDGVLRFGTRSVDVQTLFSIFTKPENCIVLKRIFDENEQIFEGYTVFRGVSVNYDGMAIVALSKL